MKPLRCLLLLLLLAPATPLWAQPGFRPKPALALARQVPLGGGLTGADLDRLSVGNQAGVLKVTGRDGSVKFLKAADHPNGGGIDGREWAPVKPADRDAILRAVGSADPDGLARRLMDAYPRLWRQAAVALLGVLATPGETSKPLKAATRARLTQFLTARLAPGDDPRALRQAVLAFAIQPKTDLATARRLMKLMKRDHNAWETFGTVQYFELHRYEITRWPQYAVLQQELAATGNPHLEQIQSILAAAATPIEGEGEGEEPQPAP